MDHDLHGVIAFLRERIGNSILLDERYTAKTDLPMNHGERNGLEDCRLTRAIDPNPRIDFEFCPMPAASEKCPVRIEKRPRSNIEPNALMRAGIHIAEVLLRIFPHDHDREGSAFSRLVNPQEAERLGAARLDTASGTNGIDFDIVR